MIYKVTCKITGKIYIGQTTQSLAQRKREHTSRSKKGSNTYFHNAIRKYGKDSFIWEVLDDKILDFDSLNKKVLVDIFLNLRMVDGSGFKFGEWCS